MSDGFDAGTAYGHIDGIDDPTMGWARYAQARCPPPSQLFADFT